MPSLRYCAPRSVNGQLVFAERLLTKLYISTYELRCSKLIGMQTKQLPESLREQQAAAGRAAMAKRTHQQRVQLGKSSWAARIAKHQQAAELVSARTLPT